MIESIVSSGTVQFQADCFPGCASNKYFFSEASLVTVFVERVGGSDGTASVEYSTADGTALSGKDFVATSGTLSWGDGDAATKTFQVQLLKDTTYEGEETVQLVLSNAVGATLPSAHASTSSITIQASDGKKF